MQPELDCDCVNGKTNPEGDTEELPRFEMCPSAGSEKNTHHRPGGSDAEQYPNSPRHPAPLQQMLAFAQTPIGTRQRKQEQAIEEKHCGAFYPPANRVGAHG